MRTILFLLPALLLAASNGGAAVSYPVVIDSALQLSATPAVASSTVFSIGDALSDSFTLEGATRRAGGKGIIRHVRVVAAQSTTVAFDVMIFTRTFTAAALNETWTVPTGEINNSFLDLVPIRAADWSALGSGAGYAANVDVDVPYDLPAGVDDLYGQCVLRLGDDSFAADNLVIRLDVVWTKRQ